MNDFLVAALYKFVAFPDCDDFQRPLRDVCLQNGITGTLLLASEGINGTIAGPEAGVRAVLAYLRSEQRFADLEVKLSRTGTMPFQRMKVRRKAEIVTMGVPGVDPLDVVGTYVGPEQWNELLEDPDVVVVDTRNEYEVSIGTFKGARDPQLRSFRQFPDWLRKEFPAGTQPRVAMFCTGGIRCEKSTAFLKQHGVEQVYHLKGGILKYLETVPEEDSLWEGECFVFDERVSVQHGLREGTYGLCRACRRPVNDADKQTPEYVEGVSCPRSAQDSTAEQRAGFEERTRQIRLARARGESHMKTARDPRED